MRFHHDGCKQKNDYDFITDFLFSTRNFIYVGKTCFFEKNTDDHHSCFSLYHFTWIRHDYMVDHVAGIPLLND